MAGMLTALVYAGRRDLRNNSTRHSFSFDSPNNLEYLSHYSSMEKNVLNHANLDDGNNLGGAAREAKQRLDDKLTSSHNRKLEKPKRKCIFHGLCRS
ncbi:hypothetical protein PIB30_013897 [Stylosanthes scabra]|uniref:Uncharacterized protein n=1 Tax=Stylosanthes scabra TaxID=79078 RepID=A0ABU6WA14_9FABA|nr:hypothetical protein [Stylosanthes scabra]